MDGIGFNLGAVFDTAIQMETEGADFYALAAEQVQDLEPRRILSQLAEMEREHRNALVELKKHLATNASQLGATVGLSWSASKSLLENNGNVGTEAEVDFAAARGGSFSNVFSTAFQMGRNSVRFFTELRQCLADFKAEGVLDHIIMDELRQMALLNAAKQVSPEA